MWPYPDVRYAIKDVLRLARAMTRKSAVAGLPLGGGKGVIMLPDGSAPPTGELRHAALLDFADTVELLEGRYITAEDVGIAEEDMIAVAEETSHVVGLSCDRGGSGDPGPWTAIGVAEAIKVCCEHTWGTSSLSGRSVAIVGAGHVGAKLAPMLTEEGATLFISDIDPRKRELAEELGAEWVDPTRAMAMEVDVLAPCALGGVLSAETVPELRCRVVAGSANNQLESDDVAELLAQRDILWAPDFVINAGGIINISVELEEDGYSEPIANDRVRGISDTLRTVLENAEQSQKPPITAAIELAQDRLDAAGHASLSLAR